MSRPISERMLSCSATLYQEATVDEDRNEVYGKSYSLSKIFVSVTYQQNNGSSGKENSDSMMLYYDCFASLPKGIKFYKGDKVVFDDQEFRVNSINPVYADGLHHYEIGLI